MPPKNQKDKEKLAADKTFGMKNKNKSKAVQKYIKQITNTSSASQMSPEDEARKKKQEKEAKLQQAALLNSLFNQGTDKKGRAFDPVAKKQAKEAEQKSIAAGSKLPENVKKDIIEGVANTIRLTDAKGVRMSELGGHAIMNAYKEKHAEVFKTIQLLLFIKANDLVFWVDDRESSNPIVRCKEDVDAEEQVDVRPIEDILEEKRRALPPGGTPVTKETFQAWKEKKEKEHAATVEAQAKAGAKGGKGPIGLSGRDLFLYDAALFVDDEGAAGAEEYDERSEVGSNAGEKGRGGGEEEAEDVESDGENPAEAPINSELFLAGDDELPDDDE